MTAPRIRSLALVLVCLLAGCPKDDDDMADAGTGEGGTGHAGSGGSAGNAGKGGAGAGGSTAGSGGSAGAGGSECPKDIAIPAICMVCADGSCGAPTCKDGKFVGFVCAGGDAGSGGSGAGGSGGSAGSDGGACNLACVRGKHCELVEVQCVRAPCPPQPMCVDDVPSDGSLHWFQSCGDPVCRADDTPFDDPSIPNCTTQQEGDACTTENDRCDGVFSCGATLICAKQAPVTCPISRARYKQDIQYLDDAGRARFHEQVTQLKLASYRYKNAPDVPQLGFMIDDVEPSVAVFGDHVNLYGYLSMAVAAIQVQDREIQRLQAELEQVRSQLNASSPAMCVDQAR